MNAIKSSVGSNKLSPLLVKSQLTHTILTNPWKTRLPFTRTRRLGLIIKTSSSNDSGEKKTERRSFLSLEEAGLVEISGLSTHERFLCRLTVSSLNLLRVISEQEGCAIEELNAGRVCDWFVKDKLKREQNLDSAVLQWDDSQFMI